MAGKRCSAARAVRNYLVSLVEQVFVKNLLEGPPFGFDKIIMIGDVRMIHICPESDDIRELSPHTFILPDGFLALLDEGLYSVLFNCFLAFDTDDLFDLDLYRQSVCVPAGFSRNQFALHGVVSRDHVLDDSGQNVADVRLSVRCRRPVKEHIGRTVFALVDALLENVIFFPEFGGFFLPLNKIQVCFYFLIHAFGSFSRQV